MAVKLFIKRAKEDRHYVMPNSESILCSLISLVLFLIKAEPSDKFLRDYFSVVTFRGAGKCLSFFSR